MEKQIEIACATIEKIAEDVILIIYKEDYHVELEDVIEVEKQYELLSNGKKIYSVLDSTNQYTSFSKEAQVFLAKDGEMIPNILAATVVFNSLPTRLLARFFINFHKPNYPMKIFGTRYKALEWIGELRRENV